MANNQITEAQAIEWIKSNPHVAIREAIKAHMGWKGCTCVFNRLMVSKSGVAYITDELTFKSEGAQANG